MRARRHHGGHAIQGFYHSDVRALRTYEVTLGGEVPEVISFHRDSAAGGDHLLLARQLDASGADPRTALTLQQSLTSRDLTARLSETATVETAWPDPVRTEMTVRLTADLSPIGLVKVGGSRPDLVWTAGPDGEADADEGADEGAELEVTADGRADAHLQVTDESRAHPQTQTHARTPARPQTPERGPVVARVSRGATRCVLRAPGARVTLEGTAVRLTWDVEADAAHPFIASWSLEARDEDAVVVAASALPEPHRSAIPDPRAQRWSETALDDLGHMLLARRGSQALPFAAAGAPWFLTLFGRDSLWTARLVLQPGDPWSLALAEGTLRALAELQGSRTEPDTAEQPGKILHERRRSALELDERTVVPPLYYGTIDATALWVLTLDEARSAGLSEAAVKDLVPALRRALDWLLDSADADGDGFIEYIDTSGHGLANQGWKDSSDSVQFADGRLADGPIALVEVQGYAYAAARAGAALLREFGETGEAPETDDESRASRLEAWAEALRRQFSRAFWKTDEDGGYPVIALDKDKRQVDALTSNIGHLLGTGILTPEQSARVAQLLVSEEMASGYGVRTLATSMRGYWPLSYHGGSVWTHDTAIAIDGLRREGFDDEARSLAGDLLSAVPAFEGRMPELFGGYSSRSGPPVPYPASCRPQAWAAAASAVVARAL